MPLYFIWRYSLRYWHSLITVMIWIVHETCIIQMMFKTLMITQLQWSKWWCIMQNNDCYKMDRFGNRVEQNKVSPTSTCCVCYIKNADIWIINTSLFACRAWSGFVTIFVYWLASLMNGDKSLKWARSIVSIFVQDSVRIFHGFG